MNIRKNISFINIGIRKKQDNNIFDCNIRLQKYNVISKEIKIINLTMHNMYLQYLQQRNNVHFWANNGLTIEKSALTICQHNILKFLFKKRFTGIRLPTSAIRVVWKSGRDGSSLRDMEVAKRVPAKMGWGWCQKKAF